VNDVLAVLRERPALLAITLLRCKRAPVRDCRLLSPTARQLRRRHRLRRWPISVGQRSRRRRHGGTLRSFQVARRG